MVSDIVVSIIMVSMITMLVLPSSPATTTLKTVGDFLTGAIKDVVGRS